MENHFGSVNNDLFREYIRILYIYLRRPLGLFLSPEYETIKNKLLRSGLRVITSFPQVIKHNRCEFLLR